jgi:hypothetical protein
MRGVILAGVFALASLSLARPAEAAVGAGVAAVEVAPAVQAQPVYWVWHGRHWNHRRWAPRIRVGGRWVPGHYTYY